MAFKMQLRVAQLKGQHIPGQYRIQTMAPPPAPVGGMPPTLPPSVEEAYRRKCIQLKTRMNEVESANDAARLRLIRLRRGIEKMRLERSFLLEQLAKRTSTNVEDSDGSPSPPSTPKEKPLRVKRGHRKPEVLNDISDGRIGTAFVHTGPATISPSSDAFTQVHPDHSFTSGRPPPPMPIPQQQIIPLQDPFQIYCHETAPIMIHQNQKAITEGTFNVDQNLSLGWQALTDEDRAVFFEKAEAVAKSVEATGPPEPIKQDGVERTRDGEDTEMGDGDNSGDGAGFTAVNRS